MKWITIDFGTRRIKALRLSLDGQRLQMEDFVSVDVRPDFYKGLALPDNPAWAAITIALNEVDWLGSNDDYVIFSALPSAYLETRYLKFPFKSEKKIEKVINFELEAAVPYDVEEIQLRSQILEGPGVAPLKKDTLVLALAYRRELIKGFESELKKFQLSNPSMTAQILSLSSLRQAIQEPEVYGILELGHSKSELVLLQSRGSILAAKTFWWGGKTLIQAIAEEFSQDPQQAEETLIRYDSEKPLTKNMTIATKSMATEMRQAFKGYQGSGLQLPKPFVIYTLGRPSKNQAVMAILEDTLKNEFEVEFKPYPLAQLRSRNLGGFDKVAEIEEALPALSIALCQMRQHRSKVPSFSETGFQFQQNLKKIRSGSFSLLRKVALLLVAPFLYAILQIVVQERENRELMTKLPGILNGTGFKIDSDETTDDLVLKMKKEFANNRAKITQMQKNEDSPLIVLTELSRLIPSHLKIDVKDLRINASSIFFSADTDTNETANKIVDSLKGAYPKIKSGNPTNCQNNSKTACKTFTVEIEREKKS